jgi:hypothetical protein
MAALDVVGTVTSDSVTSVELKINGAEFRLTQSAGIWKGKSRLNLAGSVPVLFGAVGLTGSAWDLEISVSCPDGTLVKKLSKQDTIPVSMRSRFEGTIQIPPNPCPSV